jgi:FecR protein
VKNRWAMRHKTASVLAILFLSFAGIRAANAQQRGYAPPDGREQYPDQQYPGQTGPEQPYPDDQQGTAGRAPSEQQLQTDAGVARASFLHGDVSMQRGDDNDVSAVTMNTPLMSGDKISTGGDSRGELQLDFANILRLDSNSEANLATLTRSRIQVQIAQGLAEYSVLKGFDAEMEIDTPNVSIHPLREGRYRIEVNPNGDTMIAVREGEADVSTSQGSTRVRKGENIVVHGPENDAQYRITDGPANDDWDKWNKDRDDIIYNAESYQHTNRYYTGAGDLDGHGVWSEVPDYGPVWTPNVDPGWAPYRAGRWVYEPYYGWTWVSEEPWGWAPYHYGRWFLNGAAWAWWPGPVYGGYRPVWAPAYVSFFGFGGGGISFGVGFGGGFGSIGWIPIGPSDYFHPWWGGYGGRVNVVDIRGINNFRGGIGPLHAGVRFSNLNNLSGNERLRAGISGVPAGNFGRGAISARAVSASEFRSGRMMTGGLPVSPSRESMRASDRPVPASAAARFNSQQRFFAGRSSQGAVGGGRTQAGAPGQGAPSQGAPSQGGQGWNRFNGGEQRPGGQPQAGSEGGRQSQPSAGWQRFSSQPRADASGRGYSGSPGNNSRPPLDMSKPIVNSRGPAGPAYGNDPSRGNRGGGSYGAPSYRAPNVQNAPTPSYRGDAPAPAYRGGSAPSAPSYQGAPSYRGGGGNASRGDSGGSRPSGGSSRSSGGGNRSSSGGSGRSDHGHR